MTGGDLVDATRIDTAPMEQGVKSGAGQAPDPLTRDPIIDQKMGFLGRCFGYGDEKKGNLATLAFILASVLLTICMVAPMVSADPEVLDVTRGMVTPLFGILTGIIGYVTGHKSESL